MSSSVLQVRLDEGLRAQAAAIYEALGIDLQTAVRIFLTRSVRENGLPFSMSLNERKLARPEPMLSLLHEMSEQAKSTGADALSLEEINAEIEASRAQRHAATPEAGA